jgi:hypothetical protein
MLGIANLNATRIPWSCNFLCSASVSNTDDWTRWRQPRASHLPYPDCPHSFSIESIRGAAVLYSRSPHFVTWSPLWLIVARLGYGLHDWRSIDSLENHRFFFTSQFPYQLWGIHTASYPMGTKGFFLGAKATGRHWNWPHAFIYEKFKNGWIYISTPPSCFQDVVLN